LIWPSTLSFLFSRSQLLQSLIDQLALIRQILARSAKVHFLQLVIDFLGLGRILLGELGDLPGQLFALGRGFFWRASKCGEGAGEGGGDGEFQLGFHRASLSSG
jgi:hypothetical protein